MLFNSMQHAIRTTYRARIYEHPFNQALHHGTLPIHLFYNFLEQDKHYLRQFSKSLECVSKRAINPYHRQILIQLSDDAFKTQEKLHDKYLLANCHLKFFKNDLHRMNHKSKIVNNYMRHIHDTAEMEPICVAVASLIPCFYIYSSLGFLMQQQRIAPDNPYRLWIESYSNKTFIMSTQLIIEVLNDLVATEKQATYFNPCMDAFTKSVLFEIGFWDSIYQDAQNMHVIERSLNYEKR